MHAQVYALSDFLQVYSDIDRCGGYFKHQLELLQQTMMIIRMQNINLRFLDVVLVPERRRRPVFKF
jgi:hypothetical protein